MLNTKNYPLQNKNNIGLGLSLIMNTSSRYPVWVHLNLRINAWFLNQMTSSGYQHGMRSITLYHSLFQTSQPMKE